MAFFAAARYSWGVREGLSNTVAGTSYHPASPAGDTRFQRAAIVTGIASGICFAVAGMAWMSGHMSRHGKDGEEL
jgi:hypothetical protein